MCLHARQRNQPRARSAPQRAARHHQRRAGRTIARGQVGGKGAATRFAAQDIGDTLGDRGDQRACTAPPQLGDRRIGSRAEPQAIAFHIAAPIQTIKAPIGAQRTAQRDQSRRRVRGRRTAQRQRMLHGQHVAAQTRSHAPTDPVGGISTSASLSEPQARRARDIRQCSIAARFDLRRSGGERHVPAIERPEAQRPFERRRAILRRKSAIQSRARNRAAIGLDLGSTGGDRAGKSVIDPPLTIELEPDRAVSRLDQPAPVADCNVDFGQAGRRIALAINHFVETAEADSPAAQHAVEPRTGEDYAADFRRAQTLFEADHHALRREVGRARIAHDQIGQHRGLGPDAFDLVRRRKIERGKLVFDDIARDSLPREPQGKNRYRQEDENRERHHPALLAPSRPGATGRHAIIGRNGVGRLGLGVALDPGHRLRPLRERLAKGNAA